MKKIEIVIIFTTLSLVAAYPLFAQDDTNIANKANSLYNKGEYDKAIELYDKALEKKPDSPEINFGKGAATYKKDQFDKASGLFEKGLLSKDKQFESQANYNLANSKFREAEGKEKTDLKGSINILKDALGYYKRSIDLDDRDKDAKFNYEFTQKKIALLEEKLKKEESEKKSQQNKEKDKEQKKEQNQDGQQGGSSVQKPQQSEDKEDKGSSGKEQKNSEEKNKDEKKESEENKEPQTQKNTEGQKGQEETERYEEGEPKEMSKKEAEMILKGLPESDEVRGKLEDEGERKYYPEVIKNW